MEIKDIKDQASLDAYWAERGSVRAAIRRQGPVFQDDRIEMAAEAICIIARELDRIQPSEHPERKRLRYIAAEMKKLALPESTE